MSAPEPAPALSDLPPELITLMAEFVAKPRGDPKALSRLGRTCGRLLPLVLPVLHRDVRDPAPSQLDFLIRGQPAAWVRRLQLTRLGVTGLDRRRARLVQLAAPHLVELSAGFTAASALHLTDAIARARSLVRLCLQCEDGTGDRLGELAVPPNVLDVDIVCARDSWRGLWTLAAGLHQGIRNLRLSVDWEACWHEYQGPHLPLPDHVVRSMTALWGVPEAFRQIIDSIPGIALRSIVVYPTDTPVYDPAHRALIYTSELEALRRMRTVRDAAVLSLPDFTSLTSVLLRMPRSLESLRLEDLRIGPLSQWERGAIVPLLRSLPALRTLVVEDGGADEETQAFWRQMEWAVRNRDALAAEEGSEDGGAAEDGPGSQGGDDSETSDGGSASGDAQSEP